MPSAGQGQPKDGSRSARDASLGSVGADMLQFVNTSFLLLPRTISARKMDGQPDPPWRVRPGQAWEQEH